ncbi:outer membrane beta-barrel protein [Pararhodobacter aggregans]
MVDIMTSNKSLVTRVSTLALACALPIVPALASGPVAPPPQVVDYVMPAPAFDWAGAYGGLSYSAVTGRITQSPGGTPDMESVNGWGVFGGYNWQRGNFVFGPELAYTDFEAGYPPFINRQRNVLELRARAGYAVNNVMFYGFVGAARSELFGGGVWNSENGVSYGLGAQFHIRNNFFVGVEAARRNMSFSTGGADVENDIDTISLRFGYQF